MSAPAPAPIPAAGLPPALSARCLDGKVAIVTGGAGGIGRAICQAYAQHGARVVVADLRDASRDPAETPPTHDAITAAGGTAVFARVDVTDEDSVRALVETAVARFGRLDIMVNNAGVLLEGHGDALVPMWELPMADFDTTIAVNARGTWLGIRHAIRQFLAQDPLPAPPGTATPPSRGWIVNMGSVFSLVSVPFSAAYCASKAMTTSITRTAALDAAAHDIHVNAICPGFVDTRLTSPFWERFPEIKAAVSMRQPFNGGRFGAPADVAGVAVFLASEGARWVTGAAWTVDGGYTAQ